MIEIVVRPHIGPIQSVIVPQLKPTAPCISNLFEKKAELGITQTGSAPHKPIDGGLLNIVISDGVPEGSILLIGAVTVERLQRQSGNASSIDMVLRVSAVVVKNLT